MEFSSVASRFDLLVAMEALYINVNTWEDLKSSYKIHLWCSSELILYKLRIARFREYCTFHIVIPIWKSYITNVMTWDGHSFVGFTEQALSLITILCHVLFKCNVRNYLNRNVVCDALICCVGHYVIIKFNYCALAFMSSLVGQAGYAQPAQLIVTFVRCNFKVCHMMCHRNRVCR